VSRSVYAGVIVATLAVSGCGGGGPSQTLTKRAPSHVLTRFDVVRAFRGERVFAVPSLISNRPVVESYTLMDISVTPRGTLTLFTRPAKARDLGSTLCRRSAPCVRVSNAVLVLNRTVPASVRRAVMQAMNRLRALSS
jgi:hypothetical protein